MKSSEQTNEISAALAKAQGAIKNPSKDRTAKIESPKGSYTYTYATLADSLEAIREGLSANQLALVQATRIEGGVLMLDTRLTHATGQWFESEWPVCQFPTAPQQIGSALTYARRYALSAMIGIAGEDDDAAAAKDTKVEAPQRFITPEQVEELDEMLVDLGDEVTEGFKKYFKVEFLGRLPATDFDTAKKTLVKKKAQIVESVA